MGGENGFGSADMLMDRPDNETYHTDRLTVRLLARMPDRIDDICRQLRDGTEFAMTIGADAVPCDPTIKVVEFIAWTYKRLMCKVTLTGGHVFADAVYKSPAELPETLRIAAAGRPCRGILDHPAFDDVLWSDEQNGPCDQLRADLDSDIDLGRRPGAKLRALALAEREGLATRLVG